MMPTTPKRLLDALAACQEIAELTSGLDFAGYRELRVVRLAVERLLEIVGEALNQAAAGDASLSMQFPDLRRIVALRNRNIHGYDTVNDEIIWDIVVTKIPVLERQLTSLLAAYESEPNERQGSEHDTRET